MSAELDRLIELAREHCAPRFWTPEHRREQVISFAYGNLVLDGCNVTREQVEEAYDKQG